MKKNIETFFTIGSGEICFLSEMLFDFSKKYFIDIYKTKTYFENIKTYIVEDNKIIFTGQVVCEMTVRTLDDFINHESIANLNGKLKYIKKNKNFSGFINIETENDKNCIDKNDEVQIVDIQVIDEIKELLEKTNVSDIILNDPVLKYSKVKNIMCIKLKVEILRNTNLIINPIDEYLDC